MVFAIDFRDRFFRFRRHGAMRRVTHPRGQKKRNVIFLEIPGEIAILEGIALETAAAGVVDAGIEEMPGAQREKRCAPWEEGPGKGQAPVSRRACRGSTAFSGIIQSSIGR
ncbi:MAG: hypothetical protein LBS49_13305 [Candidatus Accumulibacter sp.]|jgi:hypothetical protein|nr:hypothetical protein [Accumulibacter sp.]